MIAKSPIAYLAIKECQIAIAYLAIKERQITRIFFINKRMPNG
jgi:hypothetical protein